MARFFVVRCVLLGWLALNAAGCARARSHFDLRSLGFGSTAHSVCVMPALRAHNPAELLDDSSLTGVALERLKGLFQAASSCDKDDTGRVEVWVVAMPVAAGLQLTVGVRGVGEQGALWQREFVHAAAGASRNEAVSALNLGLEDVRRFVTLDASAGRIVSLPEARLREKVTAWFETRGVALEVESAHVLHSAPLPLLSERDGVRLAADGAAGADPVTIRVFFTPIDPHQTMLEVFKADARNGTVRERQSEVRLAELFDTEAALEILGDVQGDVEALGDFSSDLSAPEVPVDDELQRRIEHDCDVRLATLTDFSPGHVLLLPDLEGSVETAVVVQRTICAALAMGRHVTLALDVDASEQASLNAYLSSAGDRQARETLLKSPFWLRLWQDGRSSRALVRLLESIRALRAQKKPVTVLAIDAPFPGNPRMARMSSRVLAHHDAYPNRLIIGYVSNTVARLAVGAEWNTGLLPLGYRLVSAGLPVSAFDLRYNSGTRWTCRLFAQGHLRCGTWSVSPAIDAIDYDLVHSTTIFRHADDSERQFTGSVCIGEVTPSPPAADGFPDEARPWRNKRSN